MKRMWVFHPILVALFPVLFLYAHNAQEASPRELVVPVLLVLSVTILLWLVLALAFRNVLKGGLLTSFLLVLFFSTGHLQSLLNEGLSRLSDLWIRDNIALHPAVPLAIELALLLVAVGLLLFKVKDARRLTSAANVFSIAIIAFPALVGIQRMGRPLEVVPQTASHVPVNVDSVPPTRPSVKRRPDIYFIVLDGYARSDVMKELYGFDNAPFLEHLTKQGFYIARRSHANYCQTPLCLASTLNFRYLDGLVKDSPSPLEQLGDLIGENRVLRTLRPYGYKFVTFATGFTPTDHPEADVYLTPHAQLSEFQWMLVSTTPLSNVLIQPSRLSLFHLARARTQFALAQLPEIATRPEPTFTMAHIVCPHPPFVFGEHGEDLSPYGRLYNLTDGHSFKLEAATPQEYIEGYRRQAVYITEQIQQVIDRILANSPEPPIIVLQSDHGSGLRLDMESLDRTDLHERMSNFCAYYLPDEGASQLYQDMTPVNAFRVVLNHYFGAELELLEDRSYFSTWNEPLAFSDVTNRIDSTVGFELPAGGHNPDAQIAVTAP